LGDGIRRPAAATPRYPFTAAAAIIPESGAAIGADVKELSLYGCSLDCASPLLPRTRVLVKIFAATEYFEANATVIYANPSIGVGLVFRELKPHFLAVLRQWLLRAMQENQKEKRDPDQTTET